MKYNNLVAKVVFGIGLAQLACVGGIGVYIGRDPQIVEMTKKFREEVKLERILERGISIEECLSLNPEKRGQYIKDKEEYEELVKRNEFAKIGYKKSKKDVLPIAMLGLTVSSLVTMLLSGIHLYDSDPKFEKEK